MPLQVHKGGFQEKTVSPLLSLEWSSPQGLTFILQDRYVVGGKGRGLWSYRERKKWKKRKEKRKICMNSNRVKESISNIEMANLRKRLR